MILSENDIRAIVREEIALDEMRRIEREQQTRQQPNSDPVVEPAVPGFKPAPKGTAFYSANEGKA